MHIKMIGSVIKLAAVVCTLVLFAAPALALDIEDIETIGPTFDGESTAQPTVLVRDANEATAYIFSPGGGFTSLNINGSTANLSLTMALFPGLAAAADHHTCKAIEKLLEATDRGLTEAAAGTAASQPASGIATFAGQAQGFAAQFSAKGPLPDDVVAALAALAEAASSVFSMAGAAPDLLAPALVVHQAMPQICPASEVADLARNRM